MSLRTNVYFVSDSYRGDQAGNIKRLGEIFAHVVHARGAKTELRISQQNHVTGPENWMPAWVRSLRCEEPSVLKDLDPATSAVIAFELSLVDKQQLNTVGIPWVNFEIHPVRFLDDLYFNVEASFPLELSKVELPDDYILLRAGVLRAKYRPQTTVQGDNKLLIVGQAPGDKSIYFNGSFKSLPDYFSRLDSIAAEFDAVDYRPHPYLTDADADVTVRSRYATGECGEPNIYKVFANERYRAVCGISSSVLWEAPYFGLESITLEPLARKFGRPVSYGKLVRDSHFWLSGLLETVFDARDYDAPPPIPENYLRQVYCSWAYVSEDEETRQVISAIGARAQQAEAGLAEVRQELTNEENAVKQVREQLLHQEDRIRISVAEINEGAGKREIEMTEKLNGLIEAVQSEQNMLRDAALHAQTERAQALMHEAVLEERIKGAVETLKRAEAATAELQADKERYVQELHGLRVRLDETLSHAEQLKTQRTVLQVQSVRDAERIAALQEQIAAFRENTLKRDAQLTGIAEAQAVLADAMAESVRREEELRKQLAAVSADLASSQDYRTKLESQFSIRERELTNELLESQRANDHHSRLAQELEGGLKAALERNERSDAELSALLQSNHHIWAQAESRAREIQDLQAQLSSVLSANHSHWTLACERGQALDEAISQRDRLQNELHSVHQANHHHWLLLQDREQQLRAVLESSSWRITAPFRVIGAIFRKQPKWRQILQDPVGHAMRYVAARPRLKHVAQRVVRPFPGASAQLRERRAAQMRADHAQYYFQPQPQPQPQSATAPLQAYANPAGSPHASADGLNAEQQALAAALAPRAQQIFKDLIVARDRARKGQN